MTATDDLDRARSALQMINPAPYNAEAPPEALAGELTPSDLHYVRSNFPLPAHDGVLEVGGAVQNPIRLTLQDLRALPAIERAVTLECAGNGRLDMRPLPTGEPWGDYAVSTASWTGARLSDVLAQAGPNTDGVDVRFEGADHGAPFRLIAPHWYAVASVKWLKRIDVLTEPYTGEFQTGHYMYEWADRPHEPVTFMRVRARMTHPAPGSTIPTGSCTLRGKAWSGTGPVTSVELSFTGAGDWYPAQLEPAKGPYQWQDWTFDWAATDVGRHTIRVRATDSAGNVQPEIPPWNRLGYGNNAIEVPFVDVTPA